jgi:glycosyltransferase involved in cell wall biosynthesis
MSRSALCIVAGPEGYGVRRIWSTLIAGLLEHGWVVTIAVLERGHAQAWKDAFPGATVAAAEKPVLLGGSAAGTFGRYLSMLRRGFTQLGLASWLWRVVKSSDADCILFQGPLESALAGLIARLSGLKAYWFVPNAIDTTKPFDLNRRIYRALFRHAHVIPLSNSRHTDSTFGPGRFERHVVHLGIDTDHYKPGFDPAPVRSQFAIPDDAPLIGLFARMHPSKGQLRLIEALADSRTNFHILFCGGPKDGPYVAALRHRVSALNIENRVHIAGPQSDLRPYYAACDVIASLYDGVEGFGLTLVEAMACEKPAFAHGTGGPGETVLDGQTGWLIATSDTAAIAAGLKRVASDRPRWKAMGRLGRNHTIAHFSQARFQAEFLHLLCARSKDMPR